MIACVSSQQLHSHMRNIGIVRDEVTDHAAVFNAPSNTRALGLTTRHPHCCTQENFWNGKATTVDGMLDG
jgi:hypothetical protein